MGKFLTVSNSMRAKDRDGNPKVWESNYGTFDVWNVYFQDDDTKYQVNKKQGFEGYQKGQEVYGTTTLGQYGGQFKQEQAPEGSVPPSQPQQSKPTSTGNGSVDSKLDYIISLLENNAQFQGQGSRRTTNDTVVEDIDDKPVDLSQIDY